jgi:predicted ATPase with chaperone activity
MINQMLSDLLASITLKVSRSGPVERVQIFEKIFGYEGIKRTFVRSLASKEPVHLLLVGPPGQAKTMFLKCILETFGEKKHSLL